jgi:hypothetical protein
MDGEARWSAHFPAVFVPFAGACIIALGGVVLLAWAFDVTWSKEPLPELSTMKANTALCFLLGGVALLLSW